jgi:hypothetical protein
LSEPRSRREVREQLGREMRAGSGRAFAELSFLHELEALERARTDVGWLPSTESDPAGWQERDIAKDRCLCCGRLREEGQRFVSVLGEEMEFLDDPCIAALPGVVGACCGHGRRGQSVYVEGRGFGRLHGPAAAAKMRELGGNPPASAFLLDPITGGSA